KIIRHHIDISSEQIVDGRRTAAIGNFRHAELALEHQQLAEEMSGLALALMAIVDLSGIGTRISDEVLQVIEGKVSARGSNDAFENKRWVTLKVSCAAHRSV